MVAKQVESVRPLGIEYGFYVTVRDGQKQGTTRNRPLEELFYLLIAAVVLLVPVGSFLGFLAFLQKSKLTSRIDELAREVAELRAGGAVSIPADEEREDAQVPGQAREGVEPVPVETVAAFEVPPEPDLGNLQPKAAMATGVDQSESLESRLLAALKANWMVWLGALSVSLAGIFMVSHSISAGLIGPLQQLLLAVLTGCALHTGAEYLRRRHKGSDQVFAALAGGGSVTLYAALLAGVHHYGLIGPLAALTGLAIVSLATMVLALVHGPLLAIMGLSGAYLVPLLVGGEGGSAAFVLSYSTVITLSSLLLMNYVYRPWLWYGTLAGAGLWWLLVAMAGSNSLAIACYLPVLFLLFSSLPGGDRLASERRREAMGAVLVAWGLSIGWQPVEDPVFLAWTLILPFAILVPQSRQGLWYLPWAAVLATVAGWLVFSSSGYSDTLFVPLAADFHSNYLLYLMVAAVVVVLAGLWQWRTQLQSRRWPSLVLVSPVIWFTLGWLLIEGGEASGPWALMALLGAGVYGALACLMQRHQDYRSGLVWAILAAHGCYSLAIVMWLQNASLTLALSAQFVSLVWLGRRYQAPELFLVLKALMAIVVARLTFNPWLQEYGSEQHWSFWTYGGTALFAAMATWLARGLPVRPWLEAVSLHLLVLFLGAELRYWLYNGDIFVHEYGLVEAAINTLLWGALSVVYVHRARVAGSLVWLYRMLAMVLLVMSALSYLVVVLVHNPWWAAGVIGDTPVFNMLLLGFGAPVVLALVNSQFSDLVPRRWFLCVALGAFGLFTLLEIRQLWQGSQMLIGSGMTEGELYTYSVVGMLYAIIAILWSTRNGSLLLHKSGMILLGLVIGKIFLIDMAGLQGLWRVAAFMGLGLALLGLAWMYRKTSAPRGSGESPPDTEYI